MAKSMKQNYMVIALIIIIQIAFVFIYGFTSSYLYIDDSSLQMFGTEYLMMALITVLGFGLLLNYLKDCSWTAMIHTILSVGFNVQLCPLMQKFWYKIFSGSFGIDNFSKTDEITYQFDYYNGHNYLKPSIFSIRLALYCSISLIVAFNGLMGRLNLLLTIIYTIIFNIVWHISYYLNAHISLTLSWNHQVAIFDDFGCNNIFLFGSMFGFGVSLIMSCRWKAPRYSRRNQRSRNSMVWAMIGTGVIFSLFGFLGQLYPQRNNNLGVMNMIFALTGGVLGSYSVTAMIRGYVGIHETIYGTLSGGILIGTVGGLIQNIAGALSIGFIAGIISSLWLAYIFPWINRNKIIDSNGMTGLFFINGIFGSLFAGPATIASYISRKKVINGYTFVDYRDAIILIAYGVIAILIGFLIGMLVGIIGICFGTDSRILDDTCLLPRSYYFGPAPEDKYMPTEQQSSIQNSSKEQQLRMTRKESVLRTRKSKKSQIKQ